jgi:hypothetical protein
LSPLTRRKQVNITQEKPVQQTNRSRENRRAINDVIFVLGAGVDKIFGLPLLNTLFRDLNSFAHGPGKGIDKALRSQSKPRIDLQTYSGDEAENLGRKLLGTRTDLLPKILKALDKHPDAGNANVATIKVVMTKLSKIATENELDEAMVAQLGTLVGETDSVAADTVLDTDHVTFRPRVRRAIKTVLSQVSAEIQTLTPEEKTAFGEVIAILSNFEELLGDLFTGYFTGNITQQRRYFYLAWLFWAYIRFREEAGRAERGKSFYKTLSDCAVPGANIITFNYTDFFDDKTRPVDGYFHGDSKAFIRFQSREYVANDVQFLEATTLERMAGFIESLHIDWAKDPPQIALPAIVPPLALKPIICTEYLDRWYKCGQTIRKAKTIVILGYSFSVADEHFNDLIRKGNPGAELIVVNPDIDAAVNRVCQTVNHDKATLQPETVQGLECRIGGRLVFVRAKAEEITCARLTKLLEV